jgi:predicted AlkP superfamily phosphohydrolase/phosphomutase
MGTPDLRGTYGTFSFYSSDPADGGQRQVSGGIIHVVEVRDNHVHAAIPGPMNPFRSQNERASREFEVYLDPEADAAKIEIGGEEVLLAKGEWSGWLPVKFDLIPGLVKVSGIVRLHLVAVHPHLRLYTSPVNIDPASPALPISTPPEYSRELFEHAGYFYTQGLPENTAALTADVVDDTQWLSQAADIYAERLRLLDVELRRFRSGLLFVYFGGVDQVSHMFWRTLGKPESGHADAIENAYRQLDAALGQALAAIGPDVTLVVMSDHGFAPYARAVHLNSWLRDQGFLALRAAAKVGREMYRDVDWSRTKAYGLGLNGLYLNLQGRERAGVVSPAEREGVLAELARKLLDWKDPENGTNIVSRVYRREQVYSGKYVDLAPDLVVGYKRGYRVSNESALGEVPAGVIEDNVKKWSGDHCMAADEVPGVLLANRPLRSDPIALQDVAPTVLGEFSVPIPKEMVGKPMFNGGQVSHVQ